MCLRPRFCHDLIGKQPFRALTDGLVLMPSAFPTRREIRFVFRRIRIRRTANFYMPDNGSVRGEQAAFPGIRAALRQHFPGSSIRAVYEIPSINFPYSHVRIHPPFSSYEHVFDLIIHLTERPLRADMPMVVRPSAYFCIEASDEFLPRQVVGCADQFLDIFKKPSDVLGRRSDEQFSLLSVLP